ncbi:hypothetical protein BDZ91DRAFT_792026 [Kalaharituber pfeilii]|nr:hypothetical protein BDZ91DRAFT_792026 [Kalaharituber pfeilii]
MRWDWLCWSPVQFKWVSGSQAAGVPCTAPEFIAQQTLECLDPYPGLQAGPSLTVFIIWDQQIHSPNLSCMKTNPHGA